MILTPNLVVGVTLTLVGVGLLLDRADVLDVRAMLEFWPVLLALFGISVIVQALRPDTSDPRSSRPIFSPGFVLLVVLFLVFASRAGTRFVSTEATTGADASVVAVMGGETRTVTSSEFRSARMTTLMGRTRLDLRQAPLPPGSEVTIDIFGLMGGVEVFAPEGWTVDLQTTAVMGSTRDRRGLPPPAPRRRGRDRDTPEPTDTAPLEGPAPPAPPAVPVAVEPDAPPAPSAPPPRIIVRGMVMMGGLVIAS